MLQIERSTPIFVLRQSFAELQHAVLGVARSAGRLGIPVYAVRMQRGEPATRSRYVRAGFERLRGASDEQWLEALTEFDAGGAKPLLLPIDDPSAVFVHDHHETLRQRFLLPKDPQGLHRRLASKRELWKLATQLGLAAPVSSFPTSEAELVECAEQSSYPVVLKQADPWLPSRDPSAPSVLIARTRAELIDGYHRMESPMRPQVMVQEYIPGGSDAIWMFNGYFDRDSECLCAFTGRKLRQRGPRTGPATLGICAWNEVVADAATRLMRAVGYHGIIDMGFRYDDRDGQYKLLDVNPRMGSTFRLFVGENGLDVVRAAYLDLTGQTVPLTDACNGRAWLVEPYDLVAAWQLGREGTLRPGEWVRSLRAVDETAWWARDDPAPFLAMLASLGPEAVRYSKRRSRRKRRPRIASMSGEAATAQAPT